MNNEFKKIKSNIETRYVLETATAGATGSTAVATAEKPLGELQKRQSVSVPVTQKPRQGPLRQQTGAGQHRDKKKEQKQGKEKHRKPFAENTNAGSSAKDFYNFANFYNDPNPNNRPPEAEEGVRLISQGQNPKVTAQNIVNFAQANPDEVENVTNSGQLADAIEQLKLSIGQGVGEGIEQMIASGNKIIANRKTPKGDFVVLQNKNDGKYEIHKFVGPASTTGYEFMSVHRTPEEMQVAFKKLTGVDESATRQDSKVWKSAIGDWERIMRQSDYELRPGEYQQDTKKRLQTPMAGPKGQLPKENANNGNPDHEISMASSELQSIVSDAKKLLMLVKRYSEMEGLEAWQQSKITKAADYVASVLRSIGGEQGVLEGTYTRLATYRVKDPELIDMLSSQDGAEMEMAGNVGILVVDTISFPELASMASQLARQKKIEPIAGPVSRDITGKAIQTGRKYITAPSPRDVAEEEEEYDLRSAVLDGLQTVYKGALEGVDMIDYLADELSDHDEARLSDDETLRKAYEFMMNKGADAEGNPQLMARIAKKAISMLSQQGVAEDDPLAARQQYAQQHKNPGQVYKPTHLGDKKGMTKAYAYDIKRTGPKGQLPKEDVAEEKIKGVDGKACWKGKRYAGKVKKADGTYKDKCVPVSEDAYINHLMAALESKK